MPNVTKDSSQYIDNREHDEQLEAKRVTDVGSDDLVYLDNTTTTGIIYIGRAGRGTATSATGWVLTKIDTTTAPKTFKHAIDSWDNYLTATYT